MRGVSAARAAFVDYDRGMRTSPWLLLLVGSLALGAAACHGRSEQAPPATTPAGVPDFASTDASAWVNGAPTTLASLRGSVVLVEAWSPT